MLRKTTSTIPAHVHVVFELPASLWADHVFLAGDFNQWEIGNLPLHQRRDGSWQLELDLPVGQRYEFRYRVDDHWLTEFQAVPGMSQLRGENNLLETFL